MLAASPLRAESPPVAVHPGGKLSHEGEAVSTPPARKKVVVRADPRSGKLVTRTITITPPKPSAEVARIVEEAAQANGVDPLLVHSVIEVESAYDSRAVSSAGAQGLMQLMPATARELGVRDSFDPRQNIEAGVRYLKQLKDMYQDDRLALAAYNAGPGAVQKYKQVPPYPETQQYVVKVGERYQAAQRAAEWTARQANTGAGASQATDTMGAASDQERAATPESASAQTDVAGEDTHPKLEQFVDEYGRLHLRAAPR